MSTFWHLQTIINYIFFSFLPLYIQYDALSSFFKYLNFKILSTRYFDKWWNILPIKCFSLYNVKITSLFLFKWHLSCIYIWCVIQYGTVWDMHVRLLKKHYHFPEEQLFYLVYIFGKVIGHSFINSLRCPKSVSCGSKKILKMFAQRKGSI